MPCCALLACPALLTPAKPYCLLFYSYVLANLGSVMPCPILICPDLTWSDLP